MALAHTTALAASGGQTTHLSVLVNWPAEPVDSRVTTNCLVERIYQDDFEVLVSGIFRNPVGVEHSKAAAMAANTLLEPNKRVQSRFCYRLLNWRMAT